MGESWTPPALRDGPASTCPSSRPREALHPHAAGERLRAILEESLLFHHDDRAETLADDRADD